MSRTAWALATLLIAAAGCGEGTDGTPAAPPPTSPPAPTPPPAPEPPSVPSGLRVSATGEDFVEWVWNSVEIAVLSTLPLWIAAGAVWMPGLLLTAIAAALLVVSWKTIGFFPADPGIRRIGEPG